jgi:integrase
MPDHRLSIPSWEWPTDLRNAFDRAFSAVSPGQSTRLTSAFGRWLKISQTEGRDPRLVNLTLVQETTLTQSTTVAQAMRQALQGVFPDAQVFPPKQKREKESPRSSLEREIQRNWHRFPSTWQVQLKQLLRFSEDGLDDGRLVEAWKIGTLQSRCQRLWAFCDFCRDNELLDDVVPHSVAERLDERQGKYRKGEISLATVGIELQALHLFARAVFLTKNYNWLKKPIANLKKKAALQPSRNNGRIVDLPELRIAATECSELALSAHTSKPGHKAREKSHALARNALAISILINSPIRVACLATLNLKNHFDASFSKLYLSAHETKDKKRDVRAIAPSVQRQLKNYIDTHRQQFAPSEETSLFVGSRGKAVGTGYLSSEIGDVTERLFGRRVTPHVIRNVIAGFVVSAAPEEVGLVSSVLNHAPGAASTETYRKSAKQIVASRRLGAAVNQAEAAIAPKKVKTKNHHERRIGLRAARRRPA